MYSTPLTNFFSSLDQLVAVDYDYLLLHLAAIRLVRFVSSRFDSSGDRIAAAASNGLPPAFATAVTHFRIGNICHCCTSRRHVTVIIQ